MMARSCDLGGYRTLIYEPYVTESYVTEGHQEARDKKFVHISRVQTMIFHFCIYVVFEIRTVFNLECLL